MRPKACYKDPQDGKLYSYPVSPADSQAFRLPRFIDVNGCRACEAAGSPPGPKARYVEGGVCVGCLHVAAPAILAGWRAGSPDAPPVVAVGRAEAVRLGVDYFVGGDKGQGLLCRNGPHLRLTSLSTGRCLTCQGARRGPSRAAAPSARKLARRAGQRRYMPERACPECGQLAERDVVTNACRGCRVRSTLAADCPDLVVTREDARALGFTVYRTGRPCREGHTGFRYVSTGACVTCLRGRAQ